MPSFSMFAKLQPQKRILMPHRSRLLISDCRRTGQSLFWASQRPVLPVISTRQLVAIPHPRLEGVRLVGPVHLAGPVAWLDLSFTAVNSLSTSLASLRSVSLLES